MTSISNNIGLLLKVGCTAVLFVGASGSVLAQEPLMQQQGGVTVLTAPEPEAEAATAAVDGGAIDYVNATELELPIAPNFSEAEAELDAVQAIATRAQRDSNTIHIPLSSVGSEGSGKQTPITVGAPAPRPPSNTSFEFGLAGLPFSTARADLNPNATNEQYPYRASGKLFFLKQSGGPTFICSGSLVAPGLVATAAHCVTEFGRRRNYLGWRFIPGYRNGLGPYGEWTVADAYVVTSYVEGTDTCDPNNPGVICENDVAILALRPQHDDNDQPFYPGVNTGWYSYGYSRASDATRTGFTPTGIAQIAQIGYPGCLDNGGLMERNDSQAFIAPQFVRNAIIGSLMCGGSSGGGWFVNFGVRPTLTGTASGLSPQINMLVGTSSWGSTNDAVKRMGASPFLDTNIHQLVSAACAAHADACS